MYSNKNFKLTKISIYNHYQLIGKSSGDMETIAFITFLIVGLVSHWT